MSAQVHNETGEVYISSISKFLHETVGQETGSMIIQLMDFAWDDDIRDFKVVDGEKEDRQAYIDSFESECGVRNILKKYALTGDASLLSAKQGFYADLSELPVDELNPAKLESQAGVSLEKLNAVLGTSYTAEELSSMSSEELAALIKGKVEAATPKVEEKKDKKEGEE